MEDTKAGSAQNKWPLNFPEYTISQGYYPMSLLSPNNESFSPALGFQMTPELLEAILRNKGQLRIACQDDKGKYCLYVGDKTFKGNSNPVNTQDIFSLEREIPNSEVPTFKQIGSVTRKIFAPKLSAPKSKGNEKNSPSNSSGQSPFRTIMPMVSKIVLKSSKEPISIIKEEKPTPKPEFIPAPQPQKFNTPSPSGNSASASSKQTMMNTPQQSNQMMNQKVTVISNVQKPQESVNPSLQQQNSFKPVNSTPKQQNTSSSFSNQPKQVSPERRKLTPQQQQIPNGNSYLNNPQHHNQFESKNSDFISNIDLRPLCEIHSELKRIMGSPVDMKYDTRFENEECFKDFVNIYKAKLDDYGLIYKVLDENHYLVEDIHAKIENEQTEDERKILSSILSQLFVMRKDEIRFLTNRYNNLHEELTKMKNILENAFK